MGQTVEFSLKGLDQLTARVTRIAYAVPRMAAQALNEIGEETMTVAKEYTPVKYGVLRDSGKVSKPATRDDLSAQLTFGTEYAMAVHEHLSEHSPRSWIKAEGSGKRVQFHPSGTGPKFLERAMNETEKTFGQTVLAKMKQLLGI